MDMVYALYEDDYESGPAEGVFSTEEKARAYVDRNETCAGTWERLPDGTLSILKRDNVYPVHLRIAAWPVDPSDDSWRWGEPE